MPGPIKLSKWQMHLQNVVQNHRRAKSALSPCLAKQSRNPLPEHEVDIHPGKQTQATEDMTVANNHGKRNRI